MDKEGIVYSFLRGPVAQPECTGCPKYFIYALVDPRDGQWRYIGQTSSGLKRPKSHGDASTLRQNHNPHKVNWIKQLKSLGLNYKIEIIEAFNEPNKLNSAEVDWIAAARSCFVPLTNINIGGDFSTKGIKLTKEQVDRKAAINRGKTRSPEFKLRMSFLTKGRKQNAEARIKIGNAHRGNKYSLGREVNLETRNKISISLKKTLSDPIIRKVMSESRLGYSPNLEARIKASRSNGGRQIKDQNNIVYETKREAARKTGVHRFCITKVLTGEYKQTKGFKFYYV